MFFGFEDIKFLFKLLMFKFLSNLWTIMKFDCVIVQRGKEMFIKKNSISIRKIAYSVSNIRRFLIPTIYF
jgi:hypothetical protein